MLDLFGFEDSATRPTVAKSVKTTENLAFGFVEFWAAWPKHDRKVAKKQCLDKWARDELFRCTSHIVAHVEWMKKQDAWQRGFVPLPMTYLNQQHWLDWEPPQIKVQTDVLEAIKAHKGAPMPESVRKLREQLRGRA